MNTKISEPIRFRIHQIETLQFALVQNEVDREDLSFTVKFGYQLDKENNLVRAAFKFDLFNKDKVALLIEVAMDFAINPESFENQIKEDNGNRIPKDFAIHLAMVTVGTTRGILHEKTRNTAYNAFPIPTIDLTQTIKDDLVFSEQ